jgi:tRNA pseudouridine32 synthase/23S rRNA pseudouridine746 synthase
MAIANAPSKLSLPQHNPGVVTVLEFLILKFPAISSEVWQQRMLDGKVHWHDRRLISAQTPYAAQQRVYYYREVAHEPMIPFVEEVVFEDELILVAYKPHFLPVMQVANMLKNACKIVYAVKVVISNYKQYIELITVLRVWYYFQ